MKLTNSDAIPKLECPYCKVEIICKSYHNSILNKEDYYHYPHYCNAEFTDKDFKRFRMAVEKQ